MALLLHSMTAEDTSSLLHILAQLAVPPLLARLAWSSIGVAIWIVVAAAGVHAGDGAQAAAAAAAGSGTSAASGLALGCVVAGGRAQIVVSATTGAAKGITTAHTTAGTEGLIIITTAKSVTTHAATRSLSAEVAEIARIGCLVAPRAIIAAKVSSSFSSSHAAAGLAIGSISLGGAAETTTAAAFMETLGAETGRGVSGHGFLSTEAAAEVAAFTTTVEVIAGGTASAGGTTVHDVIGLVTLNEEKKKKSSQSVMGFFREKRFGWRGGVGFSYQVLPLSGISLIFTVARLYSSHY
jgi:hypothetical protein